MATSFNRNNVPLKSEVIFKHDGSCHFEAGARYFVIRRSAKSVTVERGASADRLFGYIATVPYEDIIEVL